MIATTLGHLIDAHESLKRLANLQLPAKPAYRLSKLLGKVSAETKIFNDHRNKLIEQFGTPREANPMERMGGQAAVHELKPDNPKLPEFIKAVLELRDVTVTIDWEPFDGSVLFGDGLVVSAADLAVLGPLVAWPDV